MKTWKLVLALIWSGLTVLWAVRATPYQSPSQIIDPDYQKCPFECGH